MATRTLPVPGQNPGSRQSACAPSDTAITRTVPVPTTPAQIIESVEGTMMATVAVETAATAVAAKAVPMAAVAENDIQGKMQTSAIGPLNTKRLLPRY